MEYWRQTSHHLATGSSRGYVAVQIKSAVYAPVFWFRLQSMQHLHLADALSKAT